MSSFGTHDLILKRLYHEDVLAPVFLASNFFAQIIRRCSKIFLSGLKCFVYRTSSRTHLIFVDGFKKNWSHSQLVNNSHVYNKVFQAALTMCKRTTKIVCFACLNRLSFRDSYKKVYQKLLTYIAYDW